MLFDTALCICLVICKEVCILLEANFLSVFAINANRDHIFLRLAFTRSFRLPNKLLNVPRLKQLNLQCSRLQTLTASTTPNCRNTKLRDLRVYLPYRDRKTCLLQLCEQKVIDSGGVGERELSLQKALAFVLGNTGHFFQIHLSLEKNSNKLLFDTDTFSKTRFKANTLKSHFRSAQSLPFASDTAVKTNSHSLTISDLYLKTLFNQCVMLVFQLGLQLFVHFFTALSANDMIAR